MLHGRYEHETGFVIAVEEDLKLATIFSDLTSSEIKVPLRDLKRCDDVATGLDSSGQFEVSDLYPLDHELARNSLWLSRQL